MADAMLENLQEHSRELQHRIRYLEAEHMRIRPKCLMLERIALKLMGDRDAMKFDIAELWESTSGVRGVIEYTGDREVSFLVEDLEPGEPTSDQWQPIVPGVDLGKSQTGF